MCINGAKYNKTADKQTTNVFAILCNIYNRAVKGKWKKTFETVHLETNASCKYLISEKKTAVKRSNIQSWDVFIEWSALASNFAFKSAVSACCLDSSSSREVLALWTRAISFCVSDFRFSDSTNIAFVCRCSWVKSSSSFCIFWTSTLPVRCSNLSFRCLIWSLQRCNSWQRFQIRGIHGYSKYQWHASCVDCKIGYGYYQILRAWVFLLWCWNQWKSTVCMQWHVYKWSEI